jgi:hypothetical protein
MISSPDAFGPLLQALLLIGGLVGPDPNPGQMVPLQQKLDALDRLERTGEDRDCTSVIAAIRTKKADAEQSLKRFKENEKALEDGIANELRIIANAKPGDPIQGRIEAFNASLQTLEIVKMQKTRLTTLVEGRVQEERVFMLLCGAAKAKRAAGKDP